MTPPPLRIAYIARILPLLSETFVVREMAALRRLGLDIIPLSVHPPDTSVIHPELPHLAREVEVLVRPRKPLFWLAHLYFALFHPTRYWGCLWHWVLTPLESWRRRGRAFMAFGVAPYAAFHCRRRGVAHIHAHFANVATTIAMMAARLAGVSYSFTLHSYYESFIDHLLLPQKLATADFIVSVSHYFMDRLRRRYPEALRARFHLVRCGVDVAAYAPRPRASHTPPLILAVGRLADTKGFHTLIAACAILRDRGMQINCVIIGDGLERNRLRQMIRTLNLGDRVILLGGLQPGAVKEYYAQADILALPCCVSTQPAERGNHDCLPYVLIEALALELPVVSTRIGAIPELVRDGETGLLTDPEDATAIADALARLLRDPDLARRLARAGREQVIRDFNLDHTAAILQHLYEQAVRHGPGRP